MREVGGGGAAQGIHPNLEDFCESQVAFSMVIISEGFILPGGDESSLVGPKRRGTASLSKIFIIFWSSFGNSLLTLSNAKWLNKSSRTQ
jgi:hypothetical protein